MGKLDPGYRLVLDTYLVLRSAEKTLDERPATRIIALPASVLCDLFAPLQAFVSGHPAARSA